MIIIYEDIGDFIVERSLTFVIQSAKYFSMQSSIRKTGTLMIQSRLENLPIDVHCHGVGEFDFTEIDKLNFAKIEEVLAKRNTRSILTLYLFENNLELFCERMDEFYQAQLSGKYQHIAGLAIEGPMLASVGGTPKEAVWIPSKRQWQMLSELGNKGLKYIIFSPDFPIEPHGSDDINKPATSIAWIAETLLHHNVLPVAGHFLKTSPIKSAEQLQLIYDVVRCWGRGPTLTDHLYNDMPCKVKHAWRDSEKAHRESDIEKMQLDGWQLDSLYEVLGPVPATIIHNAKDGLVKIAQNFDGEHVDLAIVKKTVELVGAENMLMMTDSIESHRLAGRDLHMHEQSSLLYQDNEVVAAGSSTVDLQIQNMQKIGLSQDQINLIILHNPKAIFHVNRLEQQKIVAAL